MLFILTIDLLLFKLIDKYFKIFSVVICDKININAYNQYKQKLFEILEILKNVKWS